MAPLSTALFYFGIFTFTLSSCSAKPTVEEQLQQLKESYSHLKEAMDAKNIQLEMKIKQLEAKDAQLEELVKQNNQKNRQGTRNAALIDSTNNISNATLRQGLTTKMPTSCLDLKSIGHQLNGVYSVIGAKYVEAVYCDFSKLAFDPSFQTLIGFTDVKSGPIYFYVKKSANDKFNLTNTPVTFSEERLNVGRAMNTSAGIFTAPKTGTYFFYLSGLVWFPESLTRVNFNIALKLNGNKITFGSTEDVSVRGKYQSFTLPSTLSLKSGDKIWFEIDLMSPGVYLNGFGRTHFTGGLLEEEIFA